MASEPGTRGDNLVFIISQPRAGSTMLQFVLGNHPDMLALGETWLMLHPIYALRTHGLIAEYSASLSRIALAEFLASIPQGEEAYIEGVRRMCAYLYGEALAPSGKRIFVDKVPRYYHILPELQRVFPEAHYIFLLRNPLAVLNSMLGRTAHGTLAEIVWEKQDFMRGPGLIASSLHTAASAITVHYEEFVRHPERETRRLCAWLGLSYSPGMENYEGSRMPRRALADRAVHAHQRPVMERTDAWRDALRRPQFWRVARAYLGWIGRDTLARLGYPYEEFEPVLHETRPGLLQRYATIPPRLLLLHPGTRFHCWSPRVIASQVSWDIMSRATGTSFSSRSR